MAKARLNFAPHAFIYSHARIGQEHDTNVYVALYSRKSKLCRKQDSFLQGIEPCAENDIGRMQIDPTDFVCKETLCQVHLHPADEEGKIMAVSPNNMAFLLNLTLPVVNFTIVMLYQTRERSHRLAVFNVTFLNDDAFAAG